MSEKNLQGSEGGDESEFWVCTTSTLVLLPNFGINFNGLVSESPEIT